MSPPVSPTATVAVPLELWRGVIELCFREMPRFYRGRADAVIEWRLHGRVDGRWQVVLRGERCSVERGGSLEPDVRLEVSDTDFVAVCLGQADGRRLVLQRRIRPRGNLLVAARLQRLFAFPSD